MQMVMTSDETQIHIFADWLAVSHAKRVTKDNKKNPEYHAVAAIRRLRTDKNCPAEKSWPNHVEDEQHIGSIVSRFQIFRGEMPPGHPRRSRRQCSITCLPHYKKVLATASKSS